MKRLTKIQTVWSPDLAYVIGIIATDGNLSSNGRSVEITSKDLQLIETVRIILKSDNKIGKKARGGSIEKNTFAFNLEI